MSTPDVRAAIARAEPFVPEPPRPLVRELPPADPFPVEALGDVLGPAARAIHARVQAPVAICAQSVLAAATLAVQGHGDVELPTGQARPVSGYFLTVAGSGERKTSADNEALWPIRKRERALREKYDAEALDHLNGKLAWEKARDGAIRRAKGDRAAIKSALDALGPAPAAPLTPMLTCPEPTFEGLCRLLAEGWPSIGIFAGEAGQFIGGHGMSDDAKLRTAAGLSSVWDGEPIRRVRAGDGASVLPGRRVAVHLLAQPDVAALMLADRLLVGQGLLSRFLVSAPESAAGTRLWREPGPEAEAALKRYGARLLDVLERPLPLAEGKLNDLAPRVLPLAPAARGLWIGFADNIETQIGPDGALSSIRPLANKVAEHAARLAGVLALAANIEAAEITSANMEAGIRLAEHYAAEGLRVFEASRIDGDLALAQRLLDWLRSAWGEPTFSLPDVYQTGPNPIRDKRTAARLVGILEDHGHAVRVEGGGVVAGQRRRDVWRIVSRT